MKKSFSRLFSVILALVMILSICSFQVSATTGKLSVDTTEFTLGEATFHFKDSASSKDFISIYYANNPGGTNSSNGELAWAYTVPASGTVTVDDFSKKDWATTPGSYLAKYWSADQYKVCLDTVYFSVIEALPEEKDIFEYYVKKNGTGDGRSAEAPAGTIGDIITAINDDGHRAGSEVTVYVIDSGEAAKTVIDSDCVIGYNRSGVGQVPSHTATIKYTSYDENVTSVIGHVNYQGSGSNAAHLLLAGPSKFENINILDMRNSNNGGTDIYLGNHSVSFNGVKFMDLKGANQGTMGEIFYPSSTHFLLGQTRGRKMVTGDAEVYLDNASLIGDYIALTGYNDNTQTQGITGNLTLRIGSGTLKNLYISGTKADEVVTGNASIVFGKGVTVSRLLAASNGKNLIVNGALQLVKNYGATVPAGATADATAQRASSAPYYEITSMSDDLTIDVTDTAGKFTVSTDKIAYAATEDGRTIYYGEDVLNIGKAGKYDVYLADSVEEIIANAQEPSHTVAYRFDGWDTTVGGVITAKLTYVGTDGAAYYVKFGGTGNGLTPTTPIGTVTDAIAAINRAGYTADDEVTIYIMDAYDIPYQVCADGSSAVGKPTYQANLKSAVTTWLKGDAYPEAWEAKLTVTSYDYEATGEATHLMWHEVYGKNVNLTLHGPIVFKDINLINPRKYDREYFINGYDVTFENTKFYHLNTDYHSGNGLKYDGILYEGHANLMLCNSATNVGGAGGYIKIDTPFTATGNPYGIWIGGTYDGTFTDRVTIDLANSDITTDLYWGSKIFTFEKGLDLIVNGGTINAISNKDGQININNGFQLIANAGNAIFDVPYTNNVVVSGGEWLIKVDSNYMFIHPTDVAGTYTVDEGLYAVAGDEETGATYIAEGTLVLPEGTYNVTSVPKAELENLKVNVTFDGVAADGIFLKGYSVALPAKNNTPVAEFLGWELNGQVYKDSYNIPANSGDLAFVSKWSGYEDTTVIYLDAAAGNDSNNGASVATAVKTLAKAFEIANTKSEGTKKVVVIGEIEVSGKMPANSSRIILTGDGTGNSVFDLYNDCIYPAGDITFENLKFTHTTSGGGKVFCTDDYHVIFGEGLTVDSDFLVRIGGYDHSKVGAVSATFLSGTFGTVEIGHFWMQNNRANVPSANVVVDGANISKFYFTSNSWDAKHTGSNYTGPVKIHVKSGRVGAIETQTSSENGRLYAEFQDTVQIIIDDGITTNVDSDFAAAAKGAWVLNVAKEDGASVEFGETAGTFKVNGTKTALATAENGAQFASTNGVLSLAAGTYDIEFSDMIYYINNGEQITVYSDCTIDLSTVKHTEKEGKEFIGWSKNGEGCALVGAHKAGDILTANYVDFKSYDAETKTGDFFIKGAQMRTSGEQGLRFIVEKKNSFANALPNVTEFGTIVLPTELTWGRDMFIDQAQVAEWTWDSETKLVFTPKSTNGYTPAKVVGEKLYAKTSDAVQYTLCITGITPEKYYRYYSVKAYIKYKDLNGVEHVLYSDYYQTNLYRVALAALEANETPTEVFEGIKEYVEVDRKAAYMAENYDTRKLLSGYPTTADKDPNHAMYQMANGMKIREVVIDSGTGGDAVEIAHFADTHLNYINQKDMDLGDINTLSTYRGRSWLRNGSSVPNISNAMEYASFFDKAVITGDVMDYFSWGCAEIMQKMIVDQSYGKVLMAMGNHEPAERMQADMSGLSDKYTLEQKYETLQELWTNDIYYHSEIVKNDEGTEKVMIVVIDNQRDRYWGDKQAEPFARDIAIAREKGIPMIMFQHDPICTRNPAEKKATWFYEVGDGSGIPCDMSNSFAGKPGSDADTMKVYNLIVQNPDVIKGVFCGHWHNHMYTEILAQNADGSFMTDANGDYVVIPQHVVTANAYGKGNAIKITIK